MKLQNDLQVGGATSWAKKGDKEYKELVQHQVQLLQISIQARIVSSITRLDLRFASYLFNRKRTMKSCVPLLLAFATSISAYGSAVVLNNSTNTIYAWSVGGAVGDRQTIVSGWCIQCELQAHYLQHQAVCT
jgi:hypothetical protein